MIDWISEIIEIVIDVAEALFCRRREKKRLADEQASGKEKEGAAE